MTKLSQCAKCKKDRRNCGFYTPEDDTDCPHYRGASHCAILDDKDDVGCIGRMVLVIVIAVISVIVSFSDVKVSFSTIVIAVSAAIVVLVAIIWLIVKGVKLINKSSNRIKAKKQMKEEQMKTDETEDVEDVATPMGSGTSELSTRTLLQVVLHRLNLQYEFDDEQRFCLKYQGENFCIVAEDDSPYLYIRDFFWYRAPLDDIDNYSLLCRAVNRCNMIDMVKFVYTCHREDNEVCLHTLYDIVWMSQIPNTESYLLAALDSILRSHHQFFQEMENLRREEFRRNN